MALRSTLVEDVVAYIGNPSPGDYVPDQTGFPVSDAWDLVSVLP
jgi:hypothetical protein